MSNITIQRTNKIPKILMLFGKMIGVASFAGLIMIEADRYTTAKGAFSLALLLGVVMWISGRTASWWMDD
jgi:hypothetical protein